MCPSFPLIRRVIREFGLSMVGRLATLLFPGALLMQSKQHQEIF